MAAQAHLVADEKALVNTLRDLLHVHRALYVVDVGPLFTQAGTLAPTLAPHWTLEGFAGLALGLDAPASQSSYTVACVYPVVHGLHVDCFVLTHSQVCELSVSSRAEVRILDCDADMKLALDDLDAQQTTSHDSPSEDDWEQYALVETPNNQQWTAMEAVQRLESKLDRLHNRMSFPEDRLPSSTRKQSRLGKSKPHGKTSIRWVAPTAKRGKLQPVHLPQLSTEEQDALWQEELEDGSDFALSSTGLLSGSGQASSWAPAWQDDQHDDLVDHGDHDDDSDNDTVRLTQHRARDDNICSGCTIT